MNSVANLYYTMMQELPQDSPYFPALLKSYWTVIYYEHSLDIGDYDGVLNAIKSKYPQMDAEYWASFDSWIDDGVDILPDVEDVDVVTKAINGAINAEINKARKEKRRANPFLMDRMYYTVTDRLALFPNSPKIKDIVRAYWTVLYFEHRHEIAYGGRDYNAPFNQIIGVFKTCGVKISQDYLDELIPLDDSEDVDEELREALNRLSKNP